MGAAESISDLRSLLSIVAEETGALKMNDADEDSVGWTTEGPLPMTFGHVRRAHAALAALENALSAVEPQPAPSGAVKALADAYKAGFDASSQGYNGEVFPEYEADNEWLAQRDSDLSALSAQVQDVAGWRYDLEAAPTGLMEFAFTNSIGFCNVRICERMGHQTDSGLRYFYREDGQKADLNANGWRAYAWRKVEVPHLYPAAPAKQEGGE